jgi:putative membrane protein
MSKLLLSTATLACLITVSCNDRNTPSVSANSPEPQARTQTQSQSHQMSAQDQEFVRKAAMGGMFEVEAGQMAARQANAQNVKDFGNRMVRDHTTVNEELKQWARTNNMTLPTAMGDEHRQHIQKLQSARGRDFDRQYMMLMVEDHQKDVDLFERQSNSGSHNELKSFAAKHLPTLREHLRMAREISGQMTSDR